MAKVSTSNKEVQGKINKIIINIIKNVLDEFNTEYFWISIRATMPNTDYDISRCHKDGKYFIDSNNETPKFATVLKGPGTLFIKHSVKTDKIYKEINNQERKGRQSIKSGKFEDYIKNQNKYRPIYAKKLKKIKIIQIKNNEGVIFYPQISEQKL